MSENIFVTFSGDKKEVPKGSTLFDLIKSLHLKDIVTAEVDGTPADLSHPLTADSTVDFYTFEDKKGKAVFWHSSAHILGNALVDLFKVKLVNGPATDDGFYYDVETASPISSSDFDRIEAKCRQITKENHRFEKEIKSKEELLAIYAENPCKTYFIEKHVKGPSSVYKNGDFQDMCLGPHVPRTGAVKALKLMKTSSVYFLNDSSQASLQRIYGISFPSQEEMRAYTARLEKAKDMDHRKIGREMDLFFFHKYSAGSCFWLPAGAHIYNCLVAWLRGEYRRRGFSEVITPNIFSIDLWKESGHYENYKDHIYTIEKEDFALKPMNCPGHCLIFRSVERSFKDLPIRLADFGVLHRNEISGALSGLTRVRRFQQDDAHIFCMREQIQSEITACLQFVDYVYGVLKFPYDILLSTRPETFLGRVEEWDEAEAALINAINSVGRPFKINDGDGAFYGPKIDIILYDALGRKTQCATIQLDFQLPQRFNLKYTGSDGAYHTPVIVHRAILGSLERLIGILIENFGKKMPFWLTPRQIAIIPLFAEAYAAKIKESLLDYEVKIIDEKGLTLNKKIRNAEVAGYRLICLVGKKEEENGEINVRFAGGNRNMKVEDFVSFIQGVVSSKGDLEEIDMEKCSLNK